MVAVGCLVTGVVMSYDVYRLATRGVEVQARFVAEHRGRPSSLEVEFTTAAGEVVRGETKNYTDRDRSNFVDIVYDPRRPSRFQAASWGFDYWLPGFWLVAGAAGAWVTARTWRRGLPAWLAGE